MTRRCERLHRVVISGGCTVLLSWLAARAVASVLERRVNEAGSSTVDAPMMKDIADDAMEEVFAANWVDEAGVGEIDGAPSQ
jgi:hypothetical protein